MFFFISIQLLHTKSFESKTNSTAAGQYLVLNRISNKNNAPIGQAIHTHIVGQIGLV